MKTSYYIVLSIILIIILVYSFLRRRRKKLFRLAYNLTIQGNTNQAIILYDILIKASPKNYIYYNNRGHCYLILEDAESAKKDLLKSIELEPDKLMNFNAYDNLEKVEHLIKFGTY